MGTLFCEHGSIPGAPGVGIKPSQINFVEGFIGLPEHKSHPQPTVPVRNSLLIRRISNKVSEKEKKKQSKVKFSN